MSWPRRLAQMFAAMRRRQPQDRIDYDSVSADNEPVTRTGPGADRGPVSTFPGARWRAAVLVWRGGKRREDLFKATHFQYLSSGERAQRWLNWFNQDGDKTRKAADSAALQE